MDVFDCLIYWLKTSQKPLIAVGRFRIFAGGGGGRGQGGANSQQAHDVVTTSMRRKDVASTSYAR